MVEIDKIREYLGEYNANYVIIGGIACNLHLQEADIKGRATKDVDMIVVCEAITPEYLRQFWKFINDGGYKIHTDNSEKRRYYRFIKPTTPKFPPYIELFSRQPEGIWLPQDAHITCLKMDEEYLSSFSAILMADDYYNYAVSHSSEIQGVRVLDKDALIVLKAKAYLNNKIRKAEGDIVHQTNIAKHKNDVYRLSHLFSDEERHELPNDIKNDLTDFLSQLNADPITTKEITKSMEIAEVPMLQFIQRIKIIFQL